MDIQTEVQKIHHQFGVSEKANYEIQKLFDKAIKEAVAEAQRDKLAEKLDDIMRLDNNANLPLPTVYFAVYIDGDYKQIVSVKADNEEQAERRLIDAGWNAPVRFETIVFGTEDVCVLFNGR